MVHTVVGYHGLGHYGSVGYIQNENSVVPLHSLGTRLVLATCGLMVHTSSVL